MNRYGTDKKYITFPNGDCDEIRRLISRRLVQLGWTPQPGDHPADRLTTINVESGSLWYTAGLGSEEGNNNHHVGSLQQLFQTEFYRRQPPFKEHVQLNSSHVAEVTRNAVTVGCQQFSHDAVIALYKSVQRAKEQ